MELILYIMAASRVKKLAAGGLALGGTVALASWVFGDDNHTKVTINDLDSQGLLF